MSSDNGSQYNLWFVNETNRDGQVFVYQDKANVEVTNLDLMEVLTWMLVNANSATRVHFKWSTSYNFVWFDNSIPASTSGQLLIKENASIPSTNNAIVGIGMSGAGTFAFPASPNVPLLFTPLPDAGDLSYRIGFGQYGLEPNGELPESAMLTYEKIQFPYGNYTMTATLLQDNTWKVVAGPPPPDTTYMFISYEAGKGLV